MLLLALVGGCGGGAAHVGGPVGTPTTSVPMTHGAGQIAFDAAGNLYAADCVDGRIFRIDPAGKASVVAGKRFGCPYGAALDSRGNLYVTDHGTNALYEIDRDGGVHRYPVAGVTVSAPVGLNWDADENLYISDRDNGNIERVTPDGAVTVVAGSGQLGFAGDRGAATKALLDQPEIVAFDDAGNMYVSDSANNRVRKVDTHGVITTFAGNGRKGYSGDGGPATRAKLSDPFGLAFDSKGNLYVAEPDEGVIRKIDAGGTITTVAGTGHPGFSGDGGPATSARLREPYGIVFDAHGDLVVSDAGNGRIRTIDTDGVITTFFDGLQHP